MRIDRESTQNRGFRETDVSVFRRGIIEKRDRPIRYFARYNIDTRTARCTYNVYNIEEGGPGETRRGGGI